MSEPLRLLTIHAHPDDESSKGAPTVAKYVAEGADAVLVCCTGGEEGDIINPAMDRPGVRDRMPEVRMQELKAATDIIGFTRVHMLGYRDSGMPDSHANEHPDSFAAAPLDDTVARLVALIRAERPHVIITYSDDQQGYRHPDHLRVHDMTIPAFEAAADANHYPDAGIPWQPLKLYYSTWSRARIESFHAAFGANGLESPYDDKWFERPSQDHRITTRIDIREWYSVRSDALRAHATQVDPEERFWFGLPDPVAAEAYPYDDYILARSEVPTELPETDLFAGVRELTTA